MMHEEKLKQPKILLLAFVNAMFERFGYYLFTAMLVLYVKDIFHCSDTRAFVLFGVFTGLNYMTPAVGGYLADNLFGIRRSLVLGLFLEALGLTLLALPYNQLLMLGLGCIIVGVGFFKTAPTHLMARTYKENDPRIDSGFTIFYMAINVGSFVSILMAGYLQRYFGWHVAFLVAACSLYCGLFSYFVLRKLAAPADSKAGKSSLALKTWFFMLGGAALSILVCAFLVSQVGITDIFFGVATLLVFIYFIYAIIKEPVKDNKLRIIACTILIIMGFVFYLLYYQAYTSINLFVNRSVDRSIGGSSIPTIAFLALNPFWILVLSPVLAQAYNFLAARKKDLAVTTKFPLGLLIISVAFFTLAVSTYFADSHSQVAGFWVIIVYFFYSLGELLIGALGVAMVTRIAPKKMYGVMMGAWFLIAMGLSGSMSGVFASLASVPLSDHNPLDILHIYSHAFWEFGAMGLAAAIIAFAISPFLKRIASIE